MNSDSSTKVLPTRWRTMRSQPANGAYNMAVDSVLLAAARDAHAVGVWRTYSWDAPTVSFGRNEAARTHFSDESIAMAGMTAVRRPTGGRALLHTHEVTYSVTMPLDARTPWHAAYRAVNEILLDAIRALGVDAQLALSEHPHPLRPDGALCFAQPAQGEIVVGDAKLVGSAVWRERGAYLQHGSILLRDSQATLLSAMRQGDHARIKRDVSAPRAATMVGCLRREPTFTEVSTALERALHNAVVGGLDGVVTDSAPIVDRDALARETLKYRDATWLWRR